MVAVATDGRQAGANPVRPITDSPGPFHTSPGRKSTRGLQGRGMASVWCHGDYQRFASGGLA